MSYLMNRSRKSWKKTQCCAIVDSGTGRVENPSRSHYTPLSLTARNCFSTGECQGLFHTSVSGSRCKWLSQSSTWASVEHYPFLSCKLIREHFSVPERFLWEFCEDKGCLFSLRSGQFCHLCSNRKLPVYWKGVFSHPVCFVRTVTISRIVRIPLWRSKRTIVITAQALSSGHTSPVCCLIESVIEPWETSGRTRLCFGRRVCLDRTVIGVIFWWSSILLFTKSLAA